ncbi:hypothetical protein AQUCO_00900935v1 [Aquilegia coerulea]|uniref:Plastocyanin-like domain-containing protein n=1 Tax=Aquilegia coerulea TaxID=218851 RepID=A0A2G5EG17_AQUCA|nr:hypothetical protein AQUCO_00900935v1 [Aquilegia coerulea]
MNGGRVRNLSLGDALTLYFSRVKTKRQHPNATFLMESWQLDLMLLVKEPSTILLPLVILQYELLSLSHTSTKKHPLFRPRLPSLNDTSFVANLATSEFPANVPHNVDKQFFFTVALGTSPCPKNHTCQGPNGSMFAASINNISFALPTKALLQAHFPGQSNGVYAPNFPSKPTIPFNYTGTPPNNTCAESHPLHLHGFNFFVIGQGFSNYDPTKDPTKFNLIDPLERNTIILVYHLVVGLQFVFCVWFMHCHLEVHTSWGIEDGMSCVGWKTP